MNMKLTRPASNGAYVKALQKKKSTLTDPIKIAEVQSLIYMCA